MACVVSHSTMAHDLNELNENSTARAGPSPGFHSWPSSPGAKRVAVILGGRSGTGHMVAQPYREIATFDRRLESLTPDIMKERRKKKREKKRKKKKEKKGAENETTSEQHLPNIESIQNRRILMRSCLSLQSIVTRPPLFSLISFLFSRHLPLHNRLLTRNCAS